MSYEQIAIDALRAVSALEDRVIALEKLVRITPPKRRIAEVWLAAIRPGKTSEYDPEQVHLSIWKVTHE